jgi:hypothetical protein
MSKTAKMADGEKLVPNPCTAENDVSLQYLGMTPEISVMIRPVTACLPQEIHFGCLTAARMLEHYFPWRQLKEFIYS